MAYTVDKMAISSRRSVIYIFYSTQNHVLGTKMGDSCLLGISKQMKQNNFEGEQIALRWALYFDIFNYYKTCQYMHLNITF